MVRTILTLFGLFLLIIVALLWILLLWMGLKYVLHMLSDTLLDTVSNILFMANACYVASFPMVLCYYIAKGRVTHYLALSFLVFIACLYAIYFLGYKTKPDKYGGVVYKVIRYAIYYIFGITDGMLIGFVVIREIMPKYITDIQTIHKAAIYIFSVVATTVILFYRQKHQHILWGMS